MSEKEDVNIQKLYGKEGTLSKEEFIKEYKIDLNGLSSKEAQARLEHYGLNEISSAKPKKWYHYLKESLFSPFNSILLGIVAILFYTDVYLPEKPSYANIIVIFILVTASTLLEFFEEFRSNKAAEKLKELVATTTTVIRDGKEVQLPVKDVTIGDIVVLSAGSMIPADLRIIESKDIYVGQSSLTGESDAVRKLAFTDLKKDDVNSLSDLDTICFMGTSVISGSGKCAVIKTADSTYFGKIAHTLKSS